MAASKFKHSLKKKLNSELGVIISNLRKENAYLKKTLAELSQHHADHNKLVERFLSLETVRLESCQPLTAKDEKAALSSEELCTKEGSSMYGVTTRRRTSTSIYTKEIEEIKNKLATISTRCQYLESKVTEKQETSDKQASISDGAVSELQSQLNDALEKNKQWLEYDQQREAYVRAVVARILELEKQLREASQTRSQQHNDDHSDDVRLSQMQGHYKKILQKAKDQKEVLQEQVEVTNQRLIIAQNWCREKEREVEELKQQLHSERMSKESAQEEHHHSQEEEQPLKDETKELKVRLNEEKRRSASFEMQGNLFQRYMLNRHHADQEKIDDLQRQIKISSQDLEDERQNCSYLKKHLVRILKVPSKAKQSKKNHLESEELHLPSQPSRDSLASSPHSSMLNESLLECPSCQAEYPASQYRELLYHVENCLE